MSCEALPGFLRLMSTTPNPPTVRSVGFYRCSGPNCGVIKNPNDRWWLLWTSFESGRQPILSLAPWDEELALDHDAIYVCGERCAQKLQSQFMCNVRENQLKREKET